MLPRHIRYFLAVAEQRNFTRAAEAMHVSQPTISQQIMLLEDELKVQLIDRSGRTVRLTDAGAAYAQYARSALQNLDAGRRAVHDVQNLSRGLLRLAMAPTFTAYLAGPLVARFSQSYPGILLDIEEATQDRIERLLNVDEVDIGITFAKALSEDLDSLPLFNETLALVVGNDHPYAETTKPMPARELAKQELVMLRADFATRRFTEAYCRRHNIKPRVAMEANSVAVIIELVRHGRFATILPEAIAREQHGLHSVALRPALAARGAVLLQRKHAYRTAASQAFADLAADWF